MPPRLLALLLVGLLPSLAAAQTAPPPGVTALKPSGGVPANLPFSEGMAVGNLVLLSGQIGNLPGSLKLANGSAEEEFRQAMDNVMATLKANDLGPRNVVKCTVMLADMKDWPEFNKVYAKYFEPPFPARSAFGANGLAVGARAEIECIAAR